MCECVRQKLCICRKLLGCWVERKQAIAVAEQHSFRADCLVLSEERMEIRGRQWAFGLSDLQMKWRWVLRLRSSEDAGGLREDHTFQGSKRRGGIAYILNWEIQLLRDLTGVVQAPEDL